ncbi:MAG: hypothetical protein JSR26_09260 [Proteobacteria bacterium]|nr:hypothetical protein [Pseudomonadota bacterium]
MTVVETIEFTCHVCGTSFASRVVQSTNTLLPQVELPGPTCPYCGEPGRTRCAYQPGRMLDLFLQLANQTSIDLPAVDRIVSGMTRADDIDAWRKGLANGHWERWLEESLQHSVSEIDRQSAEIRSEEPFGTYHQLQHDARDIQDASEAIRLFIATPSPPFESWAQMNHDLRAMMNADPRLEQGAMETIAWKWGGMADRERYAAQAWRDGSLRQKVENFLDAVERRYADLWDVAKQRIAAAGKPLPPPRNWRPH